MIYVYVDCTKEEVKNPSSFAIRISDRHLGIGSDGLILICKSEIADFKMKMFNYDGSEAEMYGNGIRCVGKYVYDKGLTKKTNITVETLAGIKKLELNKKGEKIETVKVDMGEPILEAKRIPVISKEEPVKNLRLVAADREFTFTCVSMGNPHAITIVENVKDFEVAKYGSLLEVNSHFPKKANIEFVEIKDREKIQMRVWERGSGETMACGTGACAVAVACYLQGRTEREVVIELLGGPLFINWDKETNHVFMTGPAVTVFEGEIEN